nr:GvpL/GvpF family gas vesicle protein [Desulforhopalus vacuolatus]
MNNSDEAVYLYCLGYTDSLPTLEGTGVDGNYCLKLQRLGDIVAVWSKVSLAEFCGEGAEIRLKDISWVGPRIHQHEAVVEQVMSHSPVLPTRFGTIFLSLASLKQFLKNNHDKVSQFLDQVVEREEWSVKGFLDRKKAKEERITLELSRQNETLSLLSPGKRYFQEQRIRSNVDKEFTLWLEGLCNTIAGDLNSYAANFSERQILSSEATGMDMDMILNWALLVPCEDVAAFRNLVEKANEKHDCHGLKFVLSGPWPAYSFCPTLET